MKKLFSVLLLIAMVFSLTAVSAYAEEPLKLEFFSRKPEAADCYQSLIDKFNAANPDLKVSLTSTSDADTVLLTRISSNDIPQIVNVSQTGTYFDYMRNGIFVDLTGDPILENVEDSICDMMLVYGSIYCVPCTLSPMGIFYNVELFDKMGYTMPDTFEGLIELCEKMEADGITPFAFSDKTASTIGQQSERILGGNINYTVAQKMEAVGLGETSWTKEPELRRLAEVLLELRKHCAPDNIGTSHEDALSAFVKQEVAMVYSGTWAATTINDGNPEFTYKMAIFPSIDGVEPYYCLSADTCYAISAACSEEEKAGAYRFVEYLLSAEAMDEWVKTDLTPNLCKNVSGTAECFQDAVEIMAAGRMSILPNVDEPAGFRNEWQVLIQQMFIDNDIDAFINACDELCVEYYN